jgi:hypothetical protein
MGKSKAQLHLVSRQLTGAKCFAASKLSKVAFGKLIILLIFPLLQS